MRRRTFLGGVLAGAAVAGDRLDVGALPNLEGVVVMDDASLAGASVDEGYMIRRRPSAV